MTPRDWPKVEELYHAALEKQPAEREAFLDQTCGGDEELRCEVLSLLANEAEAERLLEEPALGGATQKLAVVRGTRLGPYEVTDLVGAGGMGEVYRARDTRLGRDVAIKVLPEQVSRDAAALARFDREARAVAALSHTHIEALFDIGETDGTHYLVMELLEGETLAARLRRGALPEKEALRVGAEIAEALGAAHAHAIVHRDVKPGNVMLTRAGVKLLDFGLARLPRKASGERASTTGLGDGVLAGTLPYMAPEQLEGREADARTDIWALGCVLFEMLTGRRAFEGDSQAGLIAAIEKDAAPSLQPAAASPFVERLVRRCLEKNPEDRFQSARDVAFALDATAGASEVSGREGARRRGLWGTRHWVVPVVGVGLAALLAGVLAVRSWLRPSESARAARVVRSQIDLTSDRPLFGPDRNHPSRTVLALSPDGTLLVWTARTGVDPLEWALYLRRLDTGEVTRIPGGEKGAQPFLSPNGRWIGFVNPVGKPRLRKVRVEGGLPVDLAELSEVPMGATWGPDDRIYLGSWGRGLQWVPAEGGPLRDVTSIDRAREVGHRLPSVLPGGHELLVTVPANMFGLKTRIEVVTLATGKRKVVVDDGADGRYLPSGHLVFVRQGVLMAAPFDLARLELAAPPVSVVGDVSQALNSGGDHGNSGAAQFTVSDSGLLAYASGGMFPDTPVELLLVDEKGRTEPLPGFDRPLVSPQLSFSPDGRFLAFTEQERTGLLWLFDVERQTYRALSDRGLCGSPRWSPDGKRLAVGWSEAGPTQLWIVPAERGEWERLTREDHFVWSPSWSPDGRFLAFTGFAPSADIFIYRFEDRKIVPFLATQAQERFPEFSPDGRWLAYSSDESGRGEVYVTSFPGREKTLTVSRLGGIDPKWSRDGKRLFYTTPPPPDGAPSMMAVTVRQGPTLSLGIPTFLFRLPEGFVVNGTHNYEFHPDGRHFVVGRFVKTPAPPPITRLELVHNWFAELERLCPTRR